MTRGAIVQRVVQAGRDTPAPAPRDFTPAPPLASPASPGGAGFDFARVSVGPPGGDAAPGRLPPPLRTTIERMSGVRMDDVRVHRDSPAPARVDALAFAHGSNIHLAPGQERHLAHEAWHVVQQKRGRVRPTHSVGGAPVNDEAALESEAQAMGDRALRPAAPPREPAVAAPASVAPAGGQTVQRVKSNEAQPAKKNSTFSGIGKVKVVSPKAKAKRRRNAWLAGSHGAKKREQKRLTSSFDFEVSGDSHESEHTIGYEPLAQGSGLKRGGSDEAKELENRAPAYQEVKDLHRAHIGTGTTNKVDESGFNSPTYRDAQRNLLEKGHVSSAVQLNQLGYAHLRDPVTKERLFSDVPNSLAGLIANNSYRQMVTNVQSVTYAHASGTTTVPVDAHQRAEMYLARNAAQSGQFPTRAEENAARKLFGLDELPEKK